MANDKLTNVITKDLDGPKTANTLAREARHSRSHFFRLFRALNTEPPAAMRRRLLLERAAWSLTNTKQSITDIALDANYNSLEAFTRAFHKAFKLSPSLYRRLAPTHFHLPAPNGIHFLTTKGSSNMDLFDRFAGTDSFHTQKLLEHAVALTDEQLDRPINTTVKLLPWEKPERNLRELLERLVYTKEVWAAAMAGSEMPQAPKEPCPAAQLLKRFQQADTKFNAILSDIRNRGAWDDTFVDALCEPPEKFSFGGTFAHVITYNTYRRLTALDALRRLGGDIEGFGCPMEYENATAAAQ
jgi:AraC family transcriptional regulator